MEAPAAIRTPRRGVLRNETEWAIRESILRANDILGPDGVILKTVIPALVDGIAGMSHSKVVVAVVPDRYVEQVRMLVEAYVQTDALEILARTKRIANKEVRNALGETLEILVSFNKRWTILLKDLFRVFGDALTELLCDWTSLGPPPPSGIVTTRSLADDVCGLQPGALATVFHSKLSGITEETAASESRLIESFSLCQTKWLEAVAEKIPSDAGQNEEEGNEAEVVMRENQLNEEEA